MTEPASGPSLLARAEAIKAARDAATTRCQVARVIQQMSAEEGAELKTLLLMDKRDMPAAIIIATLKAVGYTIDETPIQAHRRALKGGQGCKCPSSTTQNT